MIQTLRKMLDLLTPREKRRLYLLLGMIIVAGIAEMVSVASVLPFMAVLARPQMLEGNGRLAGVYDALNFSSHQSFMIFLGSIVFCLVVFGLSFSTLTKYAIYRYTSMRSYSISSRLLRGYLYQPYTWFLNQHSSKLGSTLLGEVNNVIAQALVPAMLMLSQIAVVVLLIALLVAVRPSAAFVAATVVGGCYLLIYLAVRRSLTRMGQEKHHAHRARFMIANETFGGIKDVKLLGLEESYLRRFAQLSRRLAVVMATTQVLADLPRNLLKAVALGGVLFFILFLLMTGDGDLSSVLPILAIYAFTALRLFPAMQIIYSSMTKIRFARPILDKVHKDMRSLPAASQPSPVAAQPPMGLRDRLELVDIHYAYPNSDRAAVTGLSLTVKANTTIGIVGGTGAGKTTTVDLILGLLEPQSGEFKVDGVPITRANRRGWQNSVGYVPQQIFLFDDTVSANIAFGIDAEQIDQARVEAASKIAELHDFIVQELPTGYETLVGERGVRLSGGQRQRIGIARALYHDPDVLILDEATSALDNVTERAVMDAVHNLGHAKTIFLIAHRLTTVRDCDVIFILERGRVIDAGTYDELLNTSQKFRALASGVA